VISNFIESEVIMSDTKKFIEEMMKKYSLSSTVKKKKVMWIPKKEDKYGVCSDWRMKSYEEWVRLYSDIGNIKSCDYKAHQSNGIGKTRVLDMIHRNYCLAYMNKNKG
jgi:hypothetical protein